MAFADDVVSDMTGVPDGRMINNDAYWNKGSPYNYESYGGHAGSLRMGAVPRGDQFNGGSWWNPISAYKDSDYWTHFVAWAVVQEEGGVGSQKDQRLHSGTNVAIEFRRHIVELLAKNTIDGWTAGTWYRIVDTVGGYGFFRATESGQIYTVGGISQAGTSGGGIKVQWMNTPGVNETKYCLHFIGNGGLASGYSLENNRINLTSRTQNLRNMFVMLEARLVQWDTGGAALNTSGNRLLMYMGGDWFPNSYSPEGDDKRPAFAYSRSKRLTTEWQKFTATCLNEQVNIDHADPANAGVSISQFFSNKPPYVLQVDSGTTPAPTPAPTPVPTPVDLATTGVWGDREDTGVPTFVDTTDVVVTGVSISPSLDLYNTVSQTRQFTATVMGENLTDTTVTWSVSPSTNCSIDSAGLLTINSTLTGELIGTNFYPVYVRATADQDGASYGEAIVKIISNLVGTLRVKVVGIEASAAGTTGIDVSVFTPVTGSPTGTKIADASGLTIEPTLESGAAVLYVDSNNFSNLTVGQAVKVVAQNSANTQGFRGTATGVVVAE